MSQYRIRKAGREFLATRIETIQELMSRGLLGADDLVSVDGGSFRRAVEFPALAALLVGTDIGGDNEGGVATEGDSGDPTDPWRHWVDVPSEQPGSGDDALLTSFMDQLGGSSDADSDSAHAPSAAAEPVAAPRVVRAARSRSRAASEPAPPVEDAPSSPGSATIPPASSIGAEPVAPANRAIEPGASPEPPAQSGGVDVEGLPVSFQQWLDTQGDAESAIQRLGRYDEAVLAGRVPQASRFNGVRVGLLVLLGICCVLLWKVWVTTAAQTQFPTESELVERLRQGVRPAPLGSPVEMLRSIDAPVPQPAPAVTDGQTLRQRLEVELRQSLAGNILDFSTAGGLEDALFQELTNRGARPLSVEVESFGERGGADKYRRRPTQANLVIRLAAVDKEGEAGYEELERRLLLSWLLVGKYMNLGKIRFDEVAVRVQPPLAWDQRYQGAMLAAYWGRKLASQQLFISED